MPRIAVCAIVVAVALTLVPGAAYSQTCAPDAVWQGDMAGVYINSAALMRVELYDCGGIHMQWSNSYGSHRAVYTAMRRTEEGGIMAYGTLAERGAFLDDARTIWIKPAAPGSIEVVTPGVYDVSYRVYRLKKIS